MEGNATASSLHSVAG